MFNSGNNNKCILIEPPKPISKFIYLCDKKFHSELIKDLFENHKRYGVVIISGQMTKFYEICGTEIKHLDKEKVRLSKKQRKGGQSAQRFGRIREGEINKYIALISDDIDEIYIDDNDLPEIEAIVIAGNGEKKDLLLKDLHPKLKPIAHILTITEKDDIYNIKEKCDDIVLSDLGKEELEELNKFMELIEKMSLVVIYGKKEVEKMLVNNMLKKLLIHKKEVKDDKIKIIENLCKKNGCQMIIIPDINDKSERFLRNFDGIGGIAWY